MSEIVIELYKFNNCGFVLTLLIVFVGTSFLIYELGNMLRKIIHGFPKNECRFPGKLLDDIEEDTS